MIFVQFFYSTWNYTENKHFFKIKLNNSDTIDMFKVVSFAKLRKQYSMIDWICLIDWLTV